MNLKIGNLDVCYWKNFGEISDVEVWEGDCLRLNWDSSSQVSLAESLKANFVPVICNKIFQSLMDNKSEFLNLNEELSDSYKFKLVKIKNILDSSKEEGDKLAAIKQIVNKVKLY